MTDIKDAANQKQDADMEAKKEQLAKEAAVAAMEAQAMKPMTLTVEPNALIEVLATILVRNSGNKLTLESINGIAASFRTEVSKLAGMR